METNIFNYISDILFKKSQRYVTLSSEQLNIQPFMLQRWCSMSSRDNVLILNETTNKWLTTLQDRLTVYRVMHSVLPQVKFKKVAYIKKQSKSDKEEDNIKNISDAHELSQREIKESLNLINMLNL